MNNQKIKTLESIDKYGPVILDTDGNRVNLVKFKYYIPWEGLKIEMKKEKGASKLFEKLDLTDKQLETYLSILILDYNFKNNINYTYSKVRHNKKDYVSYLYKLFSFRANGILSASEIVKNKLMQLDNFVKVNNLTSIFLANQSLLSLDKKIAPVHMITPGAEIEY